MQNNPVVALLPKYVATLTSDLAELFGPVESLRHELWVVRRNEPRSEEQEIILNNIEKVLSQTL